MASVPSLTRQTLTRLIAIAALLLVGTLQVLGRPANSAAQITEIASTSGWLPAPAATDIDLLKNGGLNGDYYWMFPNHYTAPEWGRWWIEGSHLPEYDRSRGSDPYIEGDRSQRMHSWGSTFVSGIYQVANVTPCVNYQLDGSIRSDSVTGAHPNTRIGLDPTGTQLTASQNTGGVISLPALTRWSSTGTQLFTWDHFTAQAEAFGDQLTAILYAAPEPGSSQTHFYAVYFDAFSLTAVPFPDGKLPIPSSWTPSGYIQSVQTEYITPTLSIQWTTSDPSSTQILYSVTPSVITPTATMTHTIFMPLIHQSDRLPYLDTTPRTSHQATISGLKTGDVVKFIALSRRVSGASCATETSFPYEITIGSDQLIELDSSEAAALYAGQASR
jgi:hypothetical protein